MFFQEICQLRKTIFFKCDSGEYRNNKIKSSDFPKIKMNLLNKILSLTS